MGLSIITPHYNDLEGLRCIYSCLNNQTQNDWEWIIVDDYSNKDIIAEVKEWLEKLNHTCIQLICNTYKTNASVCRNIGIDHSRFERLVFLDSDDRIADDFVANRHVTVEEFTVFKNFKLVNTKNEQFASLQHTSSPLDHFLRANFIWQTTCVLWNKTFLIQIGKFDPCLHRLQDVELSIRALFSGKNYQIIDNKIDFFYCTKPIRLKKDIVQKSCQSVNYLISNIHANYTLNTTRQSNIKAYYYACVKSLHRCKNRKDVVYLKESLNLFLKKKYINTFEYLIGFSFLIFYRYKMISDSFFIRSNRYFFK